MLIKIRDTTNATEWVDDLLNGAVAAGMSDLQLRLQRQDQVLTVRARVNRVMTDIAIARGSVAIEVMNRIKAGADIPTGPAQSIADGLYEHQIGTSRWDLRIALFPTVAGETMAIRLPANRDMPSLAYAGFNKVNARRLKVLLGIANGLILMAGPVGAGKSTTMYALLGELGGSDKNTFTVEDPVERVIPGATQIQINEHSRNGWPEVLRGLRRSDLELLMIGEVRNGEQARAALEIGNAGSKVLSSIHANDSIGAVEMILELSKVSPRTLGNQLRGVISQRLLRVLHTKCEGAGCDDCNMTGYKGSRAIHEVLIVDDDLVGGLIEGKRKGELDELAKRSGMESLWQAADRLIEEGVTDMKEAKRVLGLKPGQAGERTDDRQYADSATRRGARAGAAAERDPEPAGASTDEGDAAGDDPAAPVHEGAGKAEPAPLPLPLPSPAN